MNASRILATSLLAFALPLSISCDVNAKQGGTSTSRTPSANSSNFGSNAGGNSGGQISAQGRANTNGPNSTDRDFGLARATDRRSDGANTHSHAPGCKDRTSTNCQSEKDDHR